MRRPRPDTPGPGQDSVWDYPRPPRAEPSREHVEVWLGGERIASTTAALRVLETSHPPTYYLPRGSFADGSLVPCEGSSWCEWKGAAAYFDVRGGNRTASRAAWTYPSPTPGFESLRGHIALMPGEMDGCFVAGEQVRPQDGGFYGGWITSRVAGPFKGTPGSRGW
ncbi:DUF427 domain-containing protein [Kocuria sp. M1N1S27]|uniref:DUF427 domain-containing protein n=1 Tax=Kocuria kalidii TaxID=3376283 RepID=UPI0037A05626